MGSRLINKAQTIEWLTKNGWNHLAEIVNNKPSYINFDNFPEGEMIEVELLEDMIRQDIMKELKTNLITYIYE